MRIIIGLFIAQAVAFTFAPIQAIIIGIDQLTSSRSNTSNRRVTLLHDYHTTNSEIEQPQINILKNIFIQQEQIDTSSNIHVFWERPSDSYMLFGKSVLSSLGNEIKKSCFRTNVENIEIRCAAKVALQLFDPEIDPHTALQTFPYSIIPTVNSASRVMPLDEPTINDIVYEFDLYHTEIEKWKNTLPKEAIGIINSYITRCIKYQHEHYQKILSLYDSNMKILDLAKKLYLSDNKSRFCLHKSIGDSFSHLFNLYICKKILSHEKPGELVLLSGAFHGGCVKSILEDLGLYCRTFGAGVDHCEKEPIPLSHQQMNNIFAPPSSWKWSDILYGCGKYCTIQ